MIYCWEQNLDIRIHIPSFIITLNTIGCRCVILRSDLVPWQWMHFPRNRKWARKESSSGIRPKYTLITSSSWRNDCSSSLRRWTHPYITIDALFRLIVHAVRSSFPARRPCHSVWASHPSGKQSILWIMQRITLTSEIAVTDFCQEVIQRNYIHNLQERRLHGWFDLIFRSE